MADLTDSRKFRLMWLLTIFLLVAVCGLMIQWINYRIIKVVDEYESERTHMSRIRPAPPLWTKDEWNSIHQNRLHENHSYGEEKSVNYGVLREHRHEDNGLLEPEVVKWNVPGYVGNISTWKGTKPPKKSRRRVLQFRKNEEAEKRPNSSERTSTPSPSSLVLPSPSTTFLEATTHMPANSHLKIVSSLSTGNGKGERVSVSPVSTMYSNFEATTAKQLAEQPDAAKNKATEDNVASKDNWKSPHLLNISDFTWLINNESFCQLGENATTFTITRLLVVLVHSARPHFNARQALRNSWGSIPVYKNWRIRVVFLLGKEGSEVSQNETVFQEQNKRLKSEQEKYGDIIMGSFIDSYKNLTYKHLMGFRWILNYCQNASFILKVNDNIFLDITKWIDWLNSPLEMKKENEGNVQKVIVPDFYCNVKSRMKPAREGEWKVTQEEWPLDNYPDYCHHWAYGVSIDALRKLYSVSNKTKYFWRDEIFVTGVLKTVAEKLYGWKPETTDISMFVSPKNLSTQGETVRTLCEKGEWKDKWPTYPVTYLPRGENLEMDMICLWSNILHVKLNSESKKLQFTTTEGKNDDDE